MSIKDGQEDLRTVGSDYRGSRKTKPTAGRFAGVVGDEKSWCFVNCSAGVAICPDEKTKQLSKMNSHVTASVADEMRRQVTNSISGQGF